MNCNPITEEQLSPLLNTNTINKKRITQLNKGGKVIETSLGNIQYGIPPETVKDSLL